MSYLSYPSYLSYTSYVIEESFMSKKNNVNPDHYKTAGRERQGEDIVHDVYKRWYAQSRSAAGAGAWNSIPGAPYEKHVYESQAAAEIERRINEAHRKGGGK